MKQEFGKPMSLSYVMDTPAYPFPLLDQQPPSSPESTLSSLSYPEYQRLSDEDGISNPASGLTLLERRQRNKTASAKYRQKKNRQQSEMKRMIDRLTEQDTLMKRQLVDLKIENQRLKSMNDHLRGKILAQKMLDQYFERHPSCFNPRAVEDTPDSL
jgi:hypothetical protein